MSSLRLSGSITVEPRRHEDTKKTLWYSPTGLRDAGRCRLLLRGRLQMVRDEVRPQAFDGGIGGVRVLQQLEILVRDRAPFGHRLEVQHLLPVARAVEDDPDLLRQLVGLDERQQLEQLVARAEAARKDHERLRQVCEPELAHEEI